MMRLIAIDAWATAWYLIVAFGVSCRSYSYARCGTWEAVLAGLFWPIWLVGMIFRTGEESVGFRWGDKYTEADAAEQPQVQPEPALTFAAPDQIMTSTDRARFLVDLSMIELKYGDAVAIYGVLSDRAKGDSG